MSNPAARETITLVIGKSEALVLFDFLADFHQERSLDVNDNAERLALVRLHGALAGCGKSRKFCNEEAQSTSNAA